MDSEIEKKYVQAGKIAKAISEYARKIVKPEMPVLEIAEKIEGKILELDAKPAFPVDVSCNEIAAHYSPLWQDKTLAKGLAKIDFGVGVDGYIVDNAISVDLTAEQEYKMLIKSAEQALEAAIKIVRGKRGIAVREIGKEIHRVITALGFSPIRNLSGHELKQYNLHAGLTIPNYDNGNETVLQEAVYAIEPFATAGTGIVQEGKPSGVYKLECIKAVRDSQTRKILQFIEQEYKSLPFAARWLAKKFGSRALISLQMLEQQKCLRQFPQLIEKSRMPVSQAEKTILITEKKVLVLGDED
jgi:methionyl aminopeptidase